MALSEHEQNALDRLEQQFKEEDPKFLEVMQSDPVRARSVRQIIIGLLTTLAGFFVLFLGASLQGVAANALVGILGFALTITGVHIALMRTAQTGRLRVPAPSSPTWTDPGLR